MADLLQRADMSRTCLFIINGLGLGNSTRCCAIMEHLAQDGFHIHVLTSGNGLKFFEDKEWLESLTPMESFFYSGKHGGVSGWATIKSLMKLASIAKAKRGQLSALLERIKPDIAVIDSEYALGPLRRQRVPIVAINTSEMVVSQYLKQAEKPGRVRSHFWRVEFTDYLFHKYYSDLVLSPFPLKTRTRGPKFKRIGLIARRAVLEHARKIDESSFPPPRRLRTVVFMLSGSVHASRIAFPKEIPFRVEVVGVDGESRGNVVYHGRQMNNVGLLSRADALVINGGYSAVSEAFVLGRPVFVVPVAGHAEQFINASLVEELGLGFMADEKNVVDQLLEMYRQDRWIGRKMLPDAIEIDGAREASVLIASRVEDLKGTRGVRSSRELSYAAREKAAREESVH